jgi:Transposase DDE domain
VPHWSGGGAVPLPLPPSAAEQRFLYRAQASACRTCPLSVHCTPGKKSGRSVWRRFGEEDLERVQAYQLTAAYQKALRKRKVWVEPLFAEAKAWHGLRRFRVRLTPLVASEERGAHDCGGANPPTAARSMRMGTPSAAERSGLCRRALRCLRCLLRLGTCPP